MNISYNWLKRYINLPDDAEQVAKILTSIGLEVGTVEPVESIRGGLKGLVVGEVLSCVPHPNSDHLHITKVNIGEGEPLPIVCGAPNVFVRYAVRGGRDRCRHRPCWYHRAASRHAGGHESGRLLSY